MELEASSREGGQGVRQPQSHDITRPLFIFYSWAFSLLPTLTSESRIFEQRDMMPACKHTHSPLTYHSFTK